MKVLKKALFYFAIIWVLTWVVRSIIYTGIKRNESGLFDKFNTIFEKENNYNALFIGSSRAECHFNPHIFDSVTGLNSYNIGISGSNNSFTYGIYKTYLSKSEVPEVVIMNIDFHFAHESSDTIYEFPRFFPYLNNTLLYRELQKRDKRFFLFKYFPAYTLAFLDDKYLNIAFRGYAGKPGVYDLDCYKGFQPINPLNYKNIANEDSGKYKGWILKENMDYLDSIITLTEKNNSKLYFVVSPTYIAGTKRIVNYDELMKQFESLAKRRNIPFLNYNLDSLSYKEACFADFYHMKKMGADAFTRKFSYDFAKIMIKE